MDFTLTEEERRLLLMEARETIAARLDGRKPRYGQSADAPSGLSRPCGAFVTLSLDGALRGCIGHLTAARPLRETVRQMALAAAFEDPRFSALEPRELPRCRIEISALSPMERCADPRGVQVGVHGLYLVHRGRSGVLLPQVPLEQGWDLDAYLDYICRKAGLPPGSYAEPGAELFTFTALVFGEEA